MVYKISLRTGSYSSSLNCAKKHVAKLIYLVSGHSLEESVAFNLPIISQGGGGHANVLI